MQQPRIAERRNGRVHWDEVKKKIEDELRLGTTPALRRIQAELKGKMLPWLDASAIDHPGVIYAVCRRGADEIYVGRSRVSSL